MCNGCATLVTLLVFELPYLSRELFSMKLNFKTFVYCPTVHEPTDRPNTVIIQLYYLNASLLITLITSIIIVMRDEAMRLSDIISLHLQRSLHGNEFLLILSITMSHSALSSELMTLLKHRHYNDIYRLSIP